jgi:transposase
MSMGKRKRARQPAMWVPTTNLPTAASHPFYGRLNQLLRERGFDDFAEAQCASFYADTMGRPGLPPGVYFRLLLIGYFEGIDSERGIAWRAADSLALRDFLGIGLEDAAPDHSTISRTRRLISLETHRAVFTWVLQCLGIAGLVEGKTIGIDATTLEANAALRSIVRWDTGEGYEDFLTRLAEASGIGTPTRADLARIDRKRKKKGSNDEWMHPHDPDAKITKMKDGRTHLADKAEHAIDLETGAIVGVTVQDADEGDTTTIRETLSEAAEQLEAVVAITDDSVSVIDEVVADKGYHSRTTVHDLETLEIRTYISEPDRGPQSWIDQEAERDAVYANRRRIRGRRGKRLLRRRGELVERPCAHLYETGGLRRAHVRGHENVLKRLLVHAGGFNLGLWMRRLFGVGTPRALQGRLAALRTVVTALWIFVLGAIDRRWRQDVRLLLSGRSVNKLLGCAHLRHGLLDVSVRNPRRIPTLTTSSNCVAMVASSNCNSGSPRAVRSSCPAITGSPRSASPFRPAFTA